VIGATNFRTLSDLAFHVNFAQPVSSSEDSENLVEEAKVEETDSLKQMSEGLTQAFRTVMLRFVQTIKSTGRYQFFTNSNSECARLIFKGCSDSSIENGLLTSSSTEATRDLLNKLSLKNAALQSLEAKLVTLESAEKTFNERLSTALNELQSAKSECQRLKLKVNSRGAPYY